MIILKAVSVNFVHPKFKLTRFVPTFFQVKNFHRILPEVVAWRWSHLLFCKTSSWCQLNWYIFEQSILKLYQSIFCIFPNEVFSDFSLNFPPVTELPTTASENSTKTRTSWLTWVHPERFSTFNWVQDRRTSERVFAPIFQYPLKSRILRSAHPWTASFTVF